MIGVVTGKKEFSTADHIRVVKEERRDGKKYRDGTNGAKIGGIINDQGNPEKRLFLRANHTGYWLILWGTTLIGTVLSATEV